MRKYYPYLLLILFSALLRFTYLGSVPVALSHDEIDMIIQAHSFRLTGTDLSGSWHPLALLPNDGVMAELAPYLNSLALSLLPNSLFTAHLTTAVLGSIYPALIVILLGLLGANSFAWISGLLLAISPWHILFSRTSLEQPTALFFYTLSWVFLIKLFDSNLPLRKLVIKSILFIFTFILGFYSYHGYKFSLPILTAIIALYQLIRRQKIIPTIVVITTIIILYLRLFITQGAYKSRGSEIIFANQTIFSSQTDTARRISLLPAKLTNLLSNKPVFMLKLALNKYLTLANPTAIFATGESNGVFATGQTGYIYLVLAPFLLIGLVELLTKRTNLNNLLLGLLIVSPIATVIHLNDSAAFRSAMYYVLLTVVTAYGLSVFIKRYNTRFTKLAIIIALSLSTIYFGYIYLGQYPVTSSRAYFYSDRLLANYLKYSTASTLVIDPQPRYIMSDLVLTNRLINKSTISPLIGHYNPAEEQNVYQVGNLTIRRDCPGDGTTFATVIVDSTLMAGLDVKCPAVSMAIQNQVVHRRQIVDPLDGGDNKIILNDSVCSNYPLNSYVHPQNLNAFALDSLSKLQFCQNWITEH